MKAIGKISPSVLMQACAGLLLLVLMIVFLIQSSRTGQQEYDAADGDLRMVEMHGLRLGSAMSLLMFEFQTDFDALTRSERDLRAAASRLTDPDSDLKELIEQELVLVEDFKSTQAVFRNSRSILEQTIAEFRSANGILPPEAERHLHAVERGVLDFIGRRDAPSGQALRETLDAAAPSLMFAEQWPVIRAHAENLVQYSDRLTELMGQFALLPVPQAIADYRVGIGEQLERANGRAGVYRIGLFIVCVLLLMFSSLKVLQVSRYVRMIQRSNSELDQRVRQRTAELSKANLALLNEIRERENVEAQLQIAQKLEAIGQLSAGIAHEINTPTQFVSDNVAFLEEAWDRISEVIDDYERSLINGDPDEARSRAIWDRFPAEMLREELPAAISGANKGLGQIASIVSAMKEFSHPGADSFEPADINSAIENTIVVTRNEWKYVATIETQLDRTLPPVPCNITAINQVILNLIINAAHAIGESQPAGSLGTIRISTRLAGDCAEICVKDNGPGVPAALRERIFDPFFTTKQVGKGTGQGLSIAHQIVTEMHQGTIRLSDDADGSGARFIVRIPLSLHSESNRRGEAEWEAPRAQSA